MLLRFNLRPLVASALFAATAVCGVSQSAPPANAAIVAAQESAAKGAAAVGLQKLMEQVSSQRERMISDHEALAKQLKDASDEQRKQIMGKMQEQKRAFEAAQSVLHKQIRDEQRRQRQSGAPGKR